MDSSPAVPSRGGRFVIPVPGDALVLLIGIAGSGKSTFAARHFRETEVLSSDRLRAAITDDPHAQGATDDAFDLLHRILELRLRRGRLTVVDATNVEGWARAELLGAARRHRRPAVAIVLDLPLDVALRRNLERPLPRPPAGALRRQARWLAESLPELAHEGFAGVHRLTTVERWTPRSLGGSPRRAAEPNPGTRNVPKEQTHGPGGRSHRSRPARQPKLPFRSRNR